MGKSHFHLPWQQSLRQAFEAQKAVTMAFFAVHASYTCELTHAYLFFPYNTWPGHLDLPLIESFPSLIRKFCSVISADCLSCIHFTVIDMHIASCNYHVSLM